MQRREEAQWAQQRHLAACGLLGAGVGAEDIDRLLPGWRKPPPKLTASRARAMLDAAKAHGFK